MKALIAIKSCDKHQNLEDLQRRLCFNNSPLEHRFFRGGKPEAQGDVVTLETPDDFNGLPFKVQSMCAWILNQGYERAFFIDTDTYIRPERLLEYPYGYGYDYAGFYVYDPCPGAYAVGGSGYWLSSRSMEIVASAPFIEDYPDHDSMEPSKRGEDLQVCWALQTRNIKCHKDERYRLITPGPATHNPYITLHDIRLADKTLRIPLAHSAWVESGGR
jgi:hypothetical protein